MMQQLTKENLKKILETESINNLSVEHIFRLFRNEEQLRDFLPDAIFHIDPRDGAIITYNTKRARRPHDHVTPAPTIEAKRCPICEGATTGVVDVAPLSEGFTFINKNLYPILHVLDGVDPQQVEEVTYEDPLPQEKVSYGLHFLQWTSSLHDKDWHNMPQEDRAIVMTRLAALEKKLLYESKDVMPVSNHWLSNRETYGFVSIIKNYGTLVGGSLAHGHQQIAFSNIMPRRFYNNWHFCKRKGEYFSTFMLRENPSDLLVRDYGGAVLVVPYFMKRPYNMMLLVKDTEKQYLHELDEAELTAVADGWHDAIRAIVTVMPQIGKDIAYNVITNNGPGAGLYFEFLPYTQETGGFEHLGLWVCQNNPRNVTTHLNEVLAQNGE